MATLLNRIVFIIVLLIPPISSKSQCERLLEVELGRLNSLMAAKDTAIITNNNSIIFLWMLYNEFPNEFRFKVLEDCSLELTHEDYMDLRHFTIKKKYKITRLFNAKIQKMFRPNAIKRLKCDKLKLMLSLYYLNNQLDCGVIDFKSIYKYHIGSIKRSENYKQGYYHIKNKDDYSFLYVIIGLANDTFGWDIHEWDIKQTSLNKIEEWCIGHKSCSDISLRFLEELCFDQLFSYFHIDY